jgi:cob(I)alamin adenosyltransferase
MTEKPNQGLILVFTGTGKGKTTAAMGLALRAAGHGMKTLMIQFIKGSWHYGELDAAKRLAPHFEIRPLGKGFVRFDRTGPAPEDVRAVQEAWEIFRQEMASGEYGMIILDEINNVMDYGFLPPDEVIRVLRARPAGVHLVLTGRNAPPGIVEIADLVTEMREIKHPFRNGIKAQKGVEF